MAIFPGSAIPSAVSDYEIDNSLRFNEATSALDRTPAVNGDRDTWTVSVWVKRSGLGVINHIIATDTTNQTHLRFNSDDKLNAEIYQGGYALQLITTQVFRDPSAWYHIVWVYDSGNVTSGDRSKLYLNGERITAFDTETYPSQNADSYFNSTATKMYVGWQNHTTNYPHKGYLAEVYFIDGTALAASSFGELSSTTNQWKPLDSDDVKDAVTFGTNGFFQKYNSTELANSFTDSSGGAFTGSDFSAVTSSMTFSVASVASIIDGTTTPSSGCIPTGSQTISGQDVTFDCGSGVTKIFTHAEFILSNTYDDGAWKWQGSNDDISYSDIGSGNFTVQGSVAEGPPIDITAGLSSNTTAYRYYRWLGVSGTTTASNYWTEIVNLKEAPPATGFHTITANGDVTNQRPQPHDVTANGHAHLVGPKQGTSVIAFDGSGDYLSVPDSSDWDCSSGAYTIEAWVNLNTKDSLQTIIGHGGTGSSSDKDGWILRYDTTGNKFSFAPKLAANELEAALPNPAIPNRWYHVAVDRNGSSTTIYIDGVSQATGTVTVVDAAGSTALKVGVDSDNGRPLNAYLDSIRISNTRRYTEAFTPPTTAFTNDSDTKLLIQSGTDGSQTFDDLSTPDHTITANGDVRWFVPKVGAGAMAFDGTGDYLTIPDSPDFDYTGPFTLEWWFKSRDVSTENSMYMKRAAETASNIRIGVGTNSGKLQLLISSSGSAWDIVFDQNIGSISNDTWYHLALTWDGATYTLWLDGTSVKTVTSSTAPETTSAVIHMGARQDGAEAMNGYMDGVRISNLCRYTTTFTPPTTAFTDDINTALILNADLNQGTWAEDTSTGLAISTDSRMKFDGSGDYLTTSGSDLNLSSGSWTVEGWFRTNDASASDYNQALFAASSDNYWGLMFNYDHVNTRGKLGMWMGNGSSWSIADTIGGSTTLSADTWYQVAMVFNGSTYKVYLDGAEDISVTSGTSVGSIETINIGAWGNDSLNLAGYMDEVRVSNSARYTTTFTPSTTQFTADANTKLLIHSDYTGGLGADSSGNYNNFTATNLVATDQMIDTPTNNFCTFNSAIKHDSPAVTISEGNLRLFEATGSTWAGGVGTISLSSGKWYWESLIIDTGNYLQQGICSDVSADALRGASNPQQSSGTVLYYSANGNKIVSGSDVGAYGATYGDGDIIGTALNLDDSEITFYKNNSSQGTISFPAEITSSSTVMPFTGVYSSRAQFNFGSDSSFSGDVTAQGNQDGNSKGDFYYAPPSGFLALCTDNLSDPDIALPGDYFNTVLYTGDNTTGRGITGVGFSPGFLWIKNRDAADKHINVDSVRGPTIYWSSNSGGTFTTDSNVVTSLDSDGFTVGDDVAVNTNTEDFVSWNWLCGDSFDPTAGSATVTTATGNANTTAGISVVKYVGPGGASDSFAHGLSQAVEFAIIKADAGDGAATGATPMTWDGTILISGTSAFYDSAAYWRDTAPDASLVYIGTAGEVNDGGGATSYSAYCFHSVEGYSKVGSYEGNSSSDGTFVYLGFKPAWLMIKNATTGGASRNWAFVDSTRSWANVANHTLAANLSYAESSFGGGESVGGAYNKLDLLSNGFKQRESSVWGNTTGKTYIYLAFAESPFKTSNAR